MFDEQEIIKSIAKLKNDPGSAETARQFGFYFQKYFRTLQSTEWWFAWGLFLATIICLSVTLWIFLDFLKKRERSLTMLTLACFGLAGLVPSYMFRYDPTYISGASFPVKFEWLPYAGIIVYSGLGGLFLSLASLTVYENLKEPAGNSFNRDYFAAFNSYPHAGNEPLPGPGIQEDVYRHPVLEPTPSLSLPEHSFIGETLDDGKVFGLETSTAGEKSVHLSEKNGTALIVVADGEREGTVFPIQNGTLSLGRDSCLNDVFFEDEKISGQHAKIRLEENRHVIYDLASTNRVYVNGERIVSKELEDGDRIRLGDTELVFKETDPRV